MPTTPYMDLVLPTVSVTIGPEWATELNAALTLVDSHDHTPGKGVPLTPASLDINEDLDFNSFNAINLRTTRFDSQSAALALGSDINCYYVVSGNPIYNNSSGTSSRLVNVTFPMVAGDIIYASNTTTFGRLAAGSNGNVLTLAAGIPSWASPAARLTTATETGASFTASSSVDLYLCAPSATQAVTLPVSTGGGKQFVFKHTAAAIANIITISRAASDVIVDASGNVNSTTLNSPGEEITLVDSTSGVWQVINRRIPSIWAAIALVPASGAFGTISAGSYMGRRVGDSLEIIGSFVAGTVAGGDCTVALPAGYVVDTAKMNTTLRGAVGTLYVADDATTTTFVTDGIGTCSINNSATGSFFFATQGASGNIGAAVGNVAFNNTDSFFFKAMIPIVGWNG